jgi:hypothetical protein
VTGGGPQGDSLLDANLANTVKGMPRRLAATDDHWHDRLSGDRTQLQSAHSLLLAPFGCEWVCSGTNEGRQFLLAQQNQPFSSAPPGASSDWRKQRTVLKRLVEAERNNHHHGSAGALKEAHH